MTAPAAHLSRRRFVAGAAGVLATTGLLGCSADEDHAGPHAPVAAPLPRAPRIAWVFSSGGPRGFVHVGVLKALDELGHRPDLVVGASAGALLGTLYASGMGARQIEELALDLNPLWLLRPALGAAERFSGGALADLVRDHSHHELLEQLPVMSVCVAQRLADGETVGFSRGEIGLAVQASCAIEGQFAPVRIRGQRYADADLHTPLPVRLARSLGAQRVLAVDASAHEDRAPDGARRWREGDLRKRSITQPDAASADVLLHPDFGYYVNLSREFRLRCIAAGYRDTMAAAAELQKLHASAADVG